MILWCILEVLTMNKLISREWIKLTEVERSSNKSKLRTDWSLKLAYQLKVRLQRFSKGILWVQSQLNHKYYNILNLSKSILAHKLSRTSRPPCRRPSRLFRLWHLSPRYPRKERLILSKIPWKYQLEIWWKNNQLSTNISRCQLITDQTQILPKLMQQVCL